MPEVKERAQGALIDAPPVVGRVLAWDEPVEEVKEGEDEAATSHLPVCLQMLPVGHDGLLSELDVLSTNLIPQNDLLFHLCSSIISAMCCGQSSLPLLRRFSSSQARRGFRVVVQSLQDERQYRERYPFYRSTRQQLPNGRALLVFVPR